MSAYIARSSLATLLLELAQRREPGITGLWLDFSTSAASGRNWCVSKIEAGSATDALSARDSVDEVVRENTAWIMVADDDPRDGEAAHESIGR